MTKTILFIIPIFFLILILGLVDFFYNETAIDEREIQRTQMEMKERESRRKGEEIIITITENGIEPNLVEESTSQIFFVIVNNDTVKHRMITKFGDIDSGDLEPGDSFKKNLGSTGEYILTDKYNPDISVTIHVGIFAIDDE